MQQYNQTTLKQKRERIAIIAGTGSLPLYVAQHLAQKGDSFFVVSLFPEVNKDALEAVCHEVITESAIKVGRIIQLLKNRGTTSVVFIGKVDKRALLGKLSYDWLLTKLLAQSYVKGDSDIMHLLIAELQKHGIATLSQRAILRNLFIPPGVLTGTITQQLKHDITLGMRTAEQLSLVDVGQTVVIKKGMVLAVEAIEGTDECIARGISIGSGMVVVCKTARKTQSDLFDIPTLGPESIRPYNHGAIHALAWHSQRTLIAQPDQCIALAKARGITLMSLEETSD